MSNNDNIFKLRKIIFDNLDPIINSDYCLLDVPDHKNIGDNLIWAGELEYLSRLPYKMTYTSNLFLCQDEMIEEDNIILLNGGGNFGDLYRVIQEFRNRIITKFSKNKIIIFPVTVQYKDRNILKKDAELFRKHSDITICARDQMSYDILIEHFSSNKILLIPDMAFCLTFVKFKKEAQTNKVLYLKRSDSELNTKSNTESVLLDRLKKQNKLVEIKDWPTFEISSFEGFIDGKLYAIHRRFANLLLKIPILNKVVDHRYGLNKSNSWEKYVQIGVDFINQYDEIYTTRLHVYILSILLDKKVSIFDNSYGKNSSIFNTWMKNFENSKLIK